MGGEAWPATTGSKPVARAFSCHGIRGTVCASPRALVALAPTHPEPSSSLESSWKADPSQALSGKFQTSPVIPQMVCCELSIRRTGLRVTG